MIDAADVDDDICRLRRRDRAFGQRRVAAFAIAFGISDVHVRADAIENARQRSDFVEGLDTGTVAAVCLQPRRVLADDGNGFKFACVERKKILFVLQQHHRLLGHVTRSLLMRLGVQRTFRALIQHARADHHAQVPPHLVIEH